MFYRIYALTLKRLEKLADSKYSEEVSNLSNFLESLVETRFVKAHNDFDLIEISQFLDEKIFSKSTKIQQLENKGSVYFSFKS